MSFTFVNDQVPAAPTEAGQKSTSLFFVQCTEQNGRAPLQTRALRKSHAMRKSKTEARLHAPSTKDGDIGVTAIHGLDGKLVADLAPEKTSAPRSGARSSLKPRTRPPRQYAGTSATQDDSPVLHLQRPFIVTRSYPAASSPFASVKDVTKVWQWFFYGHDVSGRDRFTVARRHFMESAWDKGRDHEIFLNSVSLYALRKRIHVAGNTTLNEREYLQQKGRLIGQIQAVLNTQGITSDTKTLLAIGTLAYCHLQDAEPEAVFAHFAALRRLHILDRVCPSEWLLIVWMDLRLSLALGVAPMLNYHIPWTYRGQHDINAELSSSALKMATGCSQASPLSEKIGFNREQCLHIFSTIFKLTIAWPRLKHTSDPPYGQLYDLEYNLRFLHARVISDTSERGTASVELLLVALQLQVWILARLWTPIAAATRSCVLRRAYILLVAADDEEGGLFQRWTLDDGGQPSALLWALSMIAVCSSGDRDGNVVPLAIKALKLVIATLKIRSADEFYDQLRQWPWTDYWHAAPMSALWQMLESGTSPVGWLSDNWWNIEAATVGPKSFGM